MAFGGPGPDRSGIGDAGHPATAAIVHGRDGRRGAAAPEDIAPRDMPRDDRAAGDGSPSPRRELDNGSPTDSAAFIAALDLGTNNCRLLIARIETDGFRVVDSFSRIVRLGEGLSATGRLAPAAMQRTMAALKICAAKLRRWQIADLRCVATEACRRADNCRPFIDQVRRETGLTIEIISPAEEAALALAGCATLLDPAQPHAILFDIGGGSTELSWLSIAADRPPRLLDWISLPVGVVTLTERFGGNLIGHERYGIMIDEVRAHFHDFSAHHDILAAVAAGQVQMLGTSGTVTTLAGIHMELPRYNRSQVDGATVAFPALTAISNDLAALDFEGRAAYPCVGRDRADLVVSGCAILEAIRRSWPVDRLRIADRGLRDGILLELRQQLLGAAPPPARRDIAAAGAANGAAAGAAAGAANAGHPDRAGPKTVPSGPAATGKRRRRRRRKAGRAAAPTGRGDPI